MWLVGRDVRRIVDDKEDEVLGAGIGFLLSVPARIARLKSSGDPVPARDNTVGEVFMAQTVRGHPVRAALRTTQR
jgi:hypothetical protein